MIKLIVAYDLNRGIGKNDSMPWHLPDELKFVSSTTRKTDYSDKVNALLMGRITYESIPENRRPLFDRKNVVVSRNKDITLKVPIFDNIHDAIKNLQNDPSIQDIFIFGGQSIYEAAINTGLVDLMLVTEIQKYFQCDRFFPKIPMNYEVIESTELFCEDIKLIRKIYGKRKF